MRTLIVGYGRMGREIEAVLARRGHTITARVDPMDPAADAGALTTEILHGADVAIEFSLPQAVAANAAAYAEARLPATVGTTGWQDRHEDVRAIVEGAGIGYVYGSNFSVGAHIFIALVEQAARLLNAFDDYDVMLYELHHNQKRDSPSGTALAAAARVLGALGRKKRIVTERLDRRIEAEELHVASIRGGSIPGTHTLVVDSAADSIEISHRARTRGGFALGAVMAAEWIRNRTGFLPAEEFIKHIFSQWR